MATIDELQLKFSADISQLNRSIQQVHGQFASLERQVNATSNRVAASMRGMTGAARALVATMGAVAFGHVARGAVDLADAMTNMQSRIRLVTGSTQSAAEMQGRLLDVANRTRTSFESIGTLYARLGRSAETLGMSQERLVGFTETFSQALKISGASTAEAESVILQLSQALASGRLSGAELNAVLEAGGRAATALADGLGVPIGALKKMGEEGRLTSQAVVAAIESQAGAIASEFSQMQMTVSDAFTVLRNDVARTVDEVNRGTGASRGLAQAFVDLGATLRDPKVTEGILKVAEVLVKAAESVAWATGKIGEGIKGWQLFAKDMQMMFADPMSMIEKRPDDVVSPMSASEQRNSQAKHRGRRNVPYFPTSGGPPAKPVTTLPGNSDKGPSAAARDAERYASAIKDLTFELEQLGRTEEAAAYAATLRNNLQRAGVELDSERGQAIAMLTAQIEQETRAREALSEADRTAADAAREFEDMRRQAGDAVASAFQRAIMEGESLRQVFAGLLADLAKMIFQKMVFETISNAISGGFASGGGVNVGNAYVVGERGPEVFVPKMPGMIVPNRSIGGGSGVVINSVVNAGAGVNREQLSVLLDERDRALTRRLPRLMIDKQRRNALAGAF